jgi:hypothetical protein
MADGAIVRLSGVDAPGAVDAAITGLVGPGTAVSLAPSADRPDRYGRRHAFVFLPDGRLLQAALVESGVARARLLPGDSDCFTDLLAHERSARRARLGLWAAPDAILSADDPSLVRRSGLYEVVAGRLASVGRGTSVTFMDFGRDYRRDFTIMLSAAVARDLTASLGPVDSLMGKRVLVRGVIENNRGAAMRLNDAAEIELIDDHPSP